ncbi:hemolysin family protein [Planctomycetota bacterium]
MDNFVPLLILGVLLVLSAAYSASETALFSISRLQLRQLRKDSSPVAAMIVELLAQPRKLLVLILLGNMFVNVAYASLSVAMAIKIYHQSQGMLPPVIFELAALAMLILAAEITPKTIAIRMPLPIARLTAPVLVFSRKILGPLQVFFHWIVEHISAIFIPRKKESFITDKELIQLLEISRRAGVIQEDERKIFSEIVSLRHFRVKEVMRPRVEMKMHKQGTLFAGPASSAEALAQPMVPVYGDTIDDILGAVAVKDVLLYPEKDIDQLMKPVFYVPEIKFVDQLLRDFILMEKTFAIAVDEHGGVAGFITIEDIIAEIFGELGPRQDPGEFHLKRIGERSFEISGRYALRELEEYLNIKIKAKGMTTLGGFVNSLLGRTPEAGDIAEYENLTLTVLETGQRRIHRVKLEISEQMNVNNNTGEKVKRLKG